MPPHVDVADLDVPPTRRGHLETLGDHAGMAHQLKGHVGAQTIRQLAHAVHALLGRLELAHVHDVIGAKCSNQVDTLIDAVNGDDLRGPVRLRDRGCIDPKAPRPLNGHGLVKRQAGASQPRDNLDQGAIQPGRHVVAEVVRRLVHRVSWLEVVVLGKRSAKMWPLLQPAEAIVLPGGAGVSVALETGWTLEVGVEIREDDAVPFLEGHSHGVGRHAGAQTEDLAGAFVAKGRRHRPAHLDHVHLAAPVVHVRAADVRETHLEHSRARLWIRDVKLAQFEGLARTQERGGHAFLGHCQFSSRPRRRSAMLGR